MSELLSFHSTKFLPPHITEFVFRTALASSPMRRFFCFVCLFTPPNYFFNRSTKLRALMSTSSHFSPTKNFWSWGASGQGRRSSTRCLPPARWPSSDLICPIFSNKWLYLNISRILQIHDQGNSDILLSVGWSFKMANTWDHWSMHDDSNRSILLLEASKYFLRHLFASTFVVKTVSSTQWSMQLNDQCNLVQCTIAQCALHTKLFFQHLTIDENGWFYFNRQEWLILVFLSSRLVDSTQTENQHSGRCMPFWRWETTKWVTESTKCEPLSTKWVTETWN